jgi:hypothetical protein
VAGENCIMNSSIICSLLFTKYYYDGQIKEDETGRQVAAMGETKNAYKVLVGKPEGNKTTWKT